MADNKDLKEMRKQMFAEMELKLRENQSEEDNLFYYHSSEDRIVLSHALFWTMTQPQYLKSKVRKEKFLPTVTAFSPRDSLSKLSSPLGLPKEFLLLRQYEEEMLDAFLQDDTKTSARCRSELRCKI